MFLVQINSQGSSNQEIPFLNDFWKGNMDFSALDKIFVLDNFNFVQEKKHFVQADGGGITFLKVSQSSQLSLFF